MSSDKVVCLAEIELLRAENKALKVEVKKLSGRLRRRGRKYEKLSKERDRLRDAIIISRGQWINSVNADQCLKALNKEP